MVTDLSRIAARDLNQKVFIKHSILNSFILFKLVLKDFFKYFLFKVTPFSRYEFWCYFFASIIILFFSGSVLLLVSFAVPFLRPVLEFIFYSLIIFFALMHMRVYAGRLINVKEYVVYVDLLPGRHKIFDKLSELFLTLFFSVRLFYVAGLLKLLFLGIYLYSNVFGGINALEFMHTLYSITLVDFLLFCLKAMGVVYFIFSVAPSVHRLDYLAKSSAEFYTVTNYNVWFVKAYIIDYLTILADFITVIIIGYIFIVGYSFTLHVLIFTAVIVQSAVFMMSGKFFPFMMGIFGLCFLLYSNIVLALHGDIDILFMTSDVVSSTINYYQISIVFLFFGLLYIATFDRDIVKVIAVISFFLSMLFMLEDSASLQGLIIYDAPSINIAVYAFIALISIFIYLVRVAYTQGSYQSDLAYAATLWNDFREGISFIKVKHIYMVLYYSSFAMAVYAFCMWLIPIVFNVSSTDIVNKNIFTIILNIRYYIAFYIFLGLFLLFKNHNDVFPMFVIAVAILVETYVLLFSTLDKTVGTIRLHPIEYVYVFIYALMTVISVCLSRYHKLMAFGFSLSFILMICALYNIFATDDFKNTFIAYNLNFIVMIISNILAAVGAHSKIKEEKRLEQYGYE